jgi:hypothetical protein
LEKCVTCAFYDRDDRDGDNPSWGQCRRTAPMLHPVNVKTYMIEGVWPHVRDDDWCGEWRSHARHARVEALVAARAAATASPPTEAPAGARASAPARPSMLTPLPGAANGATPHRVPPMSPASPLGAGIGPGNAD